MWFLDPGKSDALENKAIYSWYIDNNVPCTEPETEYMKEAEELLIKTRNSTYIKVCKEKNPKVVSSFFK